MAVDKIWLLNLAQETKRQLLLFKLRDVFFLWRCFREGALLIKILYLHTGLFLSVCNYYWNNWVVVMGKTLLHPRCNIFFPRIMDWCATICFEQVTPPFPLCWSLHSLFCFTSASSVGLPKKEVFICVLHEHPKRKWDKESMALPPSFSNHSMITTLVGFSYKPTFFCQQYPNEIFIKPFEHTDFSKRTDNTQRQLLGNYIRTSTCIAGWVLGCKMTRRGPQAMHLVQLV